MKPFAYASPATLDEAIGLLGGNGNGATTGDASTGNGAAVSRPLDSPAVVLAGGTDLLTLVKADVAAPALLIDVRRLGELDDRIEEGADGVRLGALVTLAQIERSALLRERYGALVDAA